MCIKWGESTREQGKQKKKRQTEKVIEEGKDGRRARERGKVNSLEQSDVT